MSSSASSGTRRPARLAADIELPASNFQRVILIAGLAALFCSAAWGAIRYFSNYEHTLMAVGAGALVGFATSRAGGLGGRYAWLAGALALVSIVSGKLFAYQLVMAEYEDELVASCNADTHAEMQLDATAWNALGEAPTIEAIESYMGDRGFEYDDAQQFVDEWAASLESFHAEKPTLEEWQQSVVDESRAQYTFVDYLTEDFHFLDLVFLFLGVAVAFGIVEQRTTEVRGALLADRRRKEETAQALAEHAERKAADPDEPPAQSSAQ